MKLRADSRHFWCRFLLRPWESEILMLLNFTGSPGATGLLLKSAHIGSLFCDPPKPSSLLLSRHIAVSSVVVPSPLRLFPRVRGVTEWLTEPLSMFSLWQFLASALWCSPEHHFKALGKNLSHLSESSFLMLAPEFLFPGTLMSAEVGCSSIGFTWQLAHLASGIQEL